MQPGLYGGGDGVGEVDKDMHDTSLYLRVYFNSSLSFVGLKFAEDFKNKRHIFKDAHNSITF